ncbi:MAG: beta-N-acetylhexosaminidase [Acidobacteria bacterium]|nr:beta-N-acetylhexosaminidase [Acidobacteriota bacterium]
MSLRDFRRQVGRLAIVGFNGHSVPDELRRLVAEFDLGGVIYFNRNIDTPEQVADLSRQAAGLKREWPLWISVDQEGGRVARLRRPFTEWPPAVTLGRSGDEALAARFARALATELRAVGINLDYAPVLDVHTNPKNPVIGDRALSERADAVGTLGAAVVRALQDGGVAACGKHFPGHGDTSVDSHEALPVVEHDRRRMDAVEFVPFVKAIEAGVATIMTAHVFAPALDDRQIASFSPAIVSGLLKEMLGFRGVVISDDLGMKAVSATSPAGEAAVAAVQAGCDAVLLCNHTIDEQVSALEALIRAAEAGDIPPARIDDAMRRQHDVKVRMLAADRLRPVGLDVVGCTEHQMVAAEMAAWA